MVGSLSENVRAIAVEIRVAATGVRHAGNRLTAVDKQFTQVFQTEMNQLAGRYGKQLTHEQKRDILCEMERAEGSARSLRNHGWSPEDILRELKVHYSAEVIRQRLGLPPFEVHSSITAEPPDSVQLYKRTGETPAPTDLIDPRKLYSDASQHTLAKQQGERDDVPGYGESWTARKAAIYGRSL